MTLSHLAADLGRRVCERQNGNNNGNGLNREGAKDAKENLR